MRALLHRWFGCRPVHVGGYGERYDCSRCGQGWTAHYDGINPFWARATNIGIEARRDA